MILDVGLGYQNRRQRSSFHIAYLVHAMDGVDDFERPLVLLISLRRPLRREAESIEGDSHLRDRRSVWASRMCGDRVLIRRFASC